MSGTFTAASTSAPTSIVAAGAELVDIGQTGEESWHVLADPEGNELCLLKARLDPL